MPSGSRITGRIFCLFLLWTTSAAQTEQVRCAAAGPVGALHPVRGLLETFEAGPGCAAWERGNKESHVIAVGRGTDPGNMVRVLLKCPSPSSPPVRQLHLLLSSSLPVHWWLEAETLPPGFPVEVQVSAHSTVQSQMLRLHVHLEPQLPFRPRALHQWALEHHGNLTSLTHTGLGNRVSIVVGEDPSLPPACLLQSTFLSQHYLTSDLQPQEVHGCANVGVRPEVHVIRVHSAGPGLCGSASVEVIVSLLPPVDTTKPQRLVLIFSSSLPVHWAIVAHGVRGHIFVHSSHSVSLPHPPQPGLTFSTSLHPDLSSVPHPTVWAGESGYSAVTSYTEADTANRFEIQLAGGGTDPPPLMKPLGLRPPWAEERRLRQWLSGGGGQGDSFTVRCEDGRLSVAVDRISLQALSASVTAVTLRDPACRAVTNGSHFLLVFPFVSCGTEEEFLGPTTGVRYKNMMVLWGGGPGTGLPLWDQTQLRSGVPLGVNFSCWAPLAVSSDSRSDSTEDVPWKRVDPGRDPERHHLPTPRTRSGPLLSLKLFITENYDQKRVGPCVVTAGHRVYVEISVEGALQGAAEVKSCVVSARSDPNRSPFWTVISQGCSSDPSLTLNTGAGGEPEEEQVPPLRFSFLLRPVHNDSVHFLHCSLSVCVSAPPAPPSTEETAPMDCRGRQRIPQLGRKSVHRQCEPRHLYRPMVVTRSMAALPPKLLAPPAGQRTKGLSAAPLAGPEPNHSSFLLHTGPVMGVIFTAFVLGVSLMGALWCIYSHTDRATSPVGRSVPLTDHHTWNLLSGSELTTSSV